jgi:tetratricopeptide (TPR) repeat protein
MLHSNYQMKKKVFNLLAVLTFFVYTNAQTNQQSLLTKADSFYAAASYKEAINLYEVYKKTETNTPPFSFYSKLGICYFTIKEYNQAAENFKSALQKNPPPPFIPTLLVRTAKCLAMTKDTIGAISMLEDAFGKGYANATEMETAVEFSGLRQSNKFKVVYEKLLAKYFPCKVNINYAAFDFWVGKWDVFQSGANYKVGTNTITKETGACSLIESWSSVLGSEYGTSINYLNEATQTWEQVYISSRGKKTFYYNGKLTGNKMIFEYIPVKSTDTNKIQGRFVFEKVDDNTIRQYQEESPDNGATWQKLFDFTYKKMKG